MDNKAFWDRFARRYDVFMKYFSPEYPALIERIARDIGEARRVLEVATGTGLIALELGAERSVDAVDISLVMIAQAQEKRRARGLGRVRFIVGSAYELPWQDDAYDVVICANALHVMEQPSRALAEMKRVLKARGRLVVPTYCHNEDWRARIVSHFMHLFGFRAYSRFTAREIKVFLEENGFLIEIADKSSETIPLYYVVARSA